MTEGSQREWVPRRPDDRRVPWRRRGALFALAPLGFGVLQLAAARPELVEEHYSAGLFPRVRDALRGVAGALPFHLSEVLLLLVLVTVLLALPRALAARVRGSRSLRNQAAHALTRVLAAAGLIYALFLVSWGLNHAREPYAVHAQLENSAVDRDDLEDVLRWLVAECNALREQVEPEDLALRPGPGGVDPRLLAGYAALAADVPALAGGEPLLRQAFLSPALSRLGISGIYSPFTAESHVNGEISWWVLPFASAHELAHFKGFAREDEANFIAWQACRRSPDPAIRYAATLVALSFTTGAVREYDWLQAEVLRFDLSEAVLEDLDLNRKFWASKRTVVTEVAEASNDVYLKSQGQAAGLKSYGLMVNLLVAEWRGNLLSEDS